MFKHFLFLYQNADSSENDVTEQSGTKTTDNVPGTAPQIISQQDTSTLPSQVNGTQDPLQSNDAQLHPTSVSTIANLAPNVAQPKVTTVLVIKAQPVHTNVSTVATPEPTAAQPKATTVPVSHHPLVANEG